MRCIRRVILCATLGCATLGAQRPDGLYARITTNKGVIVARLEPELTPLTVANFVGLAEGTIANAAFDPGRPFFDGTVFHRVVPGHVIQAGIPQSDRAKGPGYQFPNEIDARLSHNHAGALNMANAGPNTNSSQFCVTLGNRSYLDGNYTVFGEVVEGMDTVMRIVQGDVVETVRIERVGAKAAAFHPATESFRTLLRQAEARVAEQAEKQRAAEAAWMARHKVAAAPEGEMPAVGGGPVRVRYRGTELHYVGDVTGREGPPIEEIRFASEANGAPGFGEAAETFVFERGKTKVNPGFDAMVAAMSPGSRRSVAVPAARAYGRNGFYGPDTPGKRRFVISPHTLLVYEIEVLPE